MARGRKTGGRQKGAPNKAKAQLDAILAEAAERVTAGLSSSHIATMMPLEVMLHAMRLAVDTNHWGMATAIAEKAAPYVHPKMASRPEDGGGDTESTIRIIGGLPDE